MAYGGPSLSEITAELCMALLLATCCRFPKAMRLAKEFVPEFFKRWKKFITLKLLLRGNWPAYSSGEIHRKEVFGATIGFFGMGLIGQDVARKLEGFRPQEIIYNCRQLKKELCMNYKGFWFRFQIYFLAYFFWNLVACHSLTISNICVLRRDNKNYYINCYIMERMRRKVFRLDLVPKFQFPLNQFQKVA